MTKWGLVCLTKTFVSSLYGAIKVLHKAVGSEKVSDFPEPEKSVMKMYGSALLALRGG